MKELEPWILILFGVFLLITFILIPVKEGDRVICECLVEQPTEFTIKFKGVGDVIE